MREKNCKNKIKKLNEKYKKENTNYMQLSACFFRIIIVAFVAVAVVPAVVITRVIDVEI